MKYTLDKFFEELDPKELDEIMPGNFDDKLSKNAIKRIEKTALQKSGLKNNKRRFKFRILAPAAACLVLTAGLGGYAIAAEAKEYNAAVEFFEQNGLSAEGLSRADLKAVYRDITTNRFMNDKTVEVIKRSVPGVEILQKELDPDELAALWNCNFYNKYAPRDNIEYNLVYKLLDGTLDDGMTNSSDPKKITVECLQNGELLWEIDFPSRNKEHGYEIYVDKCLMTSLGTVVSGNRSDWMAGWYDHFTYSWLALIDDSGNKLWQGELDHGFEFEYIRAVLDNGDGTLTVISYGDFEYLCMSRFDTNGSELGFTKTQFSHISNIFNAVWLGDGYLVQLAGTDEDDALAHLVKLDSSGNVTDNFVYKSDESYYYITDMAEFKGNVYLSAYAVPKENNDGYRDGISAFLSPILSAKDDLEISPEELTPAVQAHYTAVLLLCDPNGGEPKKFYSAKSSLGGKLAVENDQLKWDVENIVSVGFSPYTSSFCLTGKSKVYRYSFDSSGALVKCEDTGEVAHYTR